MFLNAASVGVYPELVAAREKLEERIGKWPALLVAMIRVLRGYDPIEIEVDGERRPSLDALPRQLRVLPAGLRPHLSDPAGRRSA